jgi:anthranilate synthase component I
MSESQTPLPSIQSDDLVLLAAANPRRYAALFQSAAPQLTGKAIGRFDVLAICDGTSITAHLSEAENFFDTLSDALLHTQAQVDQALPRWPFHGGWVVYLGYESNVWIEASLARCVSRARTPLPTALALRAPGAIVHDRSTDQSVLIMQEGFAELGLDVLRELQNVAKRRSSGMQALREQNARLDRIAADPDQNFLDAVERVHAYLRAGDVFQVNLSRGWQAHSAQAIAPAALYHTLCHANPAPFAALLQHHHAALISSSPERLVQVQNGLVQTRPIAGTKARAANAADDAALKASLVGDPKERAEHIMLIDLERNDLGRVCVPGSVVVDELLQVESYAHVHHIVSNVRGTLRADQSPVDVLKAVFPGGTITGCPKVRCMEIIAELEQCARGAYTGAIGYINANGDMDFNILIRSITLDNQANGAHISFRAGAGIVADSVGERELQETNAKAKGMLLALQNAAAI